MEINGALKAFSKTAAISASELSLLIRMVLLAGFLLWSAWCVLELLKYYKHQPLFSVASLLKDYTKVFFLIAVVSSLVFIK